MNATSKQEARAARLARTISLAARLALVGAIWFAAARVEASPYSATDIGDINWTGEAYLDGPVMDQFGFTKTTRDLTQEEMANLPTYSAFISHPFGYDGPDYRTVTMMLMGANDSGTIVGSLASDVYSGGGAESTMVGYAVRSPDGTYSPFESLDDYQGLWATRIILSQANQILVFGEHGAKLYDVDTRTTTPIDQLIPPDLLKKFSSFNADDIDDRGDILINAFGPNGPEYYILTPPGLDPPPVPEPSMLVIFAAAGALAVRAARRRGSA